MREVGEFIFLVFCAAVAVAALITAIQGKIENRRIRKLLESNPRKAYRDK